MGIWDKIKIGYRPRTVQPSTMQGPSPLESAILGINSKGRNRTKNGTYSLAPNIKDKGDLKGVIEERFILKK